MTPAPTTMTSNRPYLIRAMYEWIGDNDMTPHLLVDASHPHLRCPPQAVQEGRVVLNIAARAVAQLELGNDAIRFKARFSGVSQEVSVPLAAVQAIYAQETGQGMMLPEEESRDSGAPEGGRGPGPGDEGPGGGSGSPRLRVVK